MAIQDVLNSLDAIITLASKDLNRVRVVQVLRQRNLIDDAKLAQIQQDLQADFQTLHDQAATLPGVIT